LHKLKRRSSWAPFSFACRGEFFTLLAVYEYSSAAVSVRFFLVSLLGGLFFLSLLLTWLWLHYARRQLWLDIPNQRSAHRVPTPSSGGIGFVVVFTGYSLVQVLVTPAVTVAQWLPWVAAAGLATVGFVDDRAGLNPKFRLGVQVVAVALLWPLLQALPALALVSNWVLPAVFLQLGVVLASIWFINLYNFMDGIDGLAASEAVFICGALTLLLWPIAPLPTLMPLLVLASALLGFLCLNWSPAKLFMGDVGSYFLGFSLLVLGLNLVQQQLLNYWVLLILPSTFLIDSTTTLIGRLRAGAVWYHPHSTHVYQVLARLWRSHARVVSWNLLINCCWVLPLAWLALRFPAWGALLVLLAWAPLVVAVLRVRASSQLPVSSSIDE
jgi:Fuc2NAc and GlcNAc transferase